MPTNVVRWGDTPHENVGRPTAYGNSNVIRSRMADELPEVRG